MNETRKAIIDLIELYMDKTLSEGCLIKSFTRRDGTQPIFKVSDIGDDGLYI